jgi:hypothetical protein
MTELDEESIKIYGRPLQGKYKHFCIEFDYLPIDEHSFEFQFCLCYEDSPEIDAYKEIQRKKL